MLHFRELLIAMNRRMREEQPKIEGFAQSEADHARDYFREHYNETISIEQYAASRNMSSSFFNKAFRAAVGEPPLQYILSLRIRNAQILLETTDATVAEIARSVGYENSMYFSRLFKRAKGVPPLKYRKIYREKLVAEG